MKHFKTFENFNAVDEGFSNSILSYFGIDSIKDITKTKNWAKIMKMAKGANVGKYLGFKHSDINVIEVIGDKGYMAVEFSKYDRPQIIKKGEMFA